MTEFSIEKQNGNKIPCIMSIPEECRKIVIVIHGIASSKESSNAENLMKYFYDKNIGVVAYDQPGHGQSDAADEELRTENCLESLKSVEDYIAEIYPEAEICYFGSSFGAYILGIYLARGMNRGKKAFMRCAAVCFSRLINEKFRAAGITDSLGNLPQDDIEVDLGVEKPVIFTKGFMKDLRANDLEKMYEESRPEDVKIRFAHGGDDPVVPVDSVKTFSEKYGYELKVIPNEEHSISSSPRSPFIVADFAYELFKQPEPGN